MLGTSGRALLGPAMVILLPAIAVVSAAVAAAHLAPEPAQRRLFDNVHWTVSYGAAAALAWLGARSAPADDRGPRRWFALALLFYFVGQLAWDVQVASGWNPFPGPSDLCFILLGPLSGAGLMALFRRTASLGQRRSLLLDVTMLSAAVLTLTLALYLPKQGTTSPLQMAFLVAYPVVLGWAACVGLVFALTLRLEPQRGWVMLLLGLIANGALWLSWNALTLDHALSDGTTYNALFSLTALVQGTGALLWKAEESSSRRWQRWCDGALRTLPLIGVTLSAAGVIVAFTVHGVPPAVKATTLVGALVVVLVSSVRQALLLGERDRLLEERAQADVAVRASEEKYRTLMEQAADGIFIADAQGVYIDVNARGAEMLGMERSEVIGLSISDIVLPDEQGRVGPELTQLHQGATMKGEWRMKRKDGSWFWSEVTAKMLSDGRLQGLVRDVSDRKRAEEQRLALEAQLVQSQKMQAVGSLAAGIAHDFNNMLSAIRGNAELAALDLAPDHPARVSVEEIRKAGRRATELVQQIVAFSRPSKPASEVVQLPAVVDEVVRLLRSTLPAGVEITTRYVRPLPPVLADPTQMHQVLVNLCTNAWQAMDGRPGAISVEVARAAEPPAALGLGAGEYVKLSVQDDGSGMAAEIRDRIFEPFFTTKGVGKGTGLGLSVVHNIVKSHNGGIEVRSEPGRGTTFTVYLPRASAGVSAGVEAVPSPAPSRKPGRRVFYVDDDEALVFLVTRQLQRQGHEVKGFSSPLDVLAQVEKDPYAFDVLVTDYNMPKMSGITLIQEIRKLRSDAPVILTSGSLSDEIRVAAERCGASSLIHKPDTDDALSEAIDRAAARLT